MADADGFFGKITPPLLAAARRLRWVQAPTASLEHFLFPELTDHPCTLTNMRGLFSDVIADQVFGYILCFARNLHRYILPHVAGYGPRIAERHLTVLLENICRFVRGEPLRNVVDKTRWF